jgi:hypothetical protein
MTLNEKVAKVDKTFADLKKFVDEGEYEYGAMLVRTIVEIIVNSYTDYYTPEIKNADQLPTIMEQIDALDKCSSFPKAQIYNLHEMRKLSNKGSHQGTEETVSSTQIKAIIPNIEDEIRAWKLFADKGHESLIEIDRAKHEAILNGSVEKDPVKVKVSLVVTVIVFAAILFFTYQKTIQFFTMGLHYEETGLLIYWGCALAFFIFAAYFRSYGKVQKLIYNVLAVYFAVPRIYQTILCLMGHGSFFEGVIYLILAVVVLGGYSVLALHVGQQKGGIVGYR